MKISKLTSLLALGGNGDKIWYLCRGCCCRLPYLEKRMEQEKEKALDLIPPSISSTRTTPDIRILTRDKNDFYVKKRIEKNPQWSGNHVLHNFQCMFWYRLGEKTPHLIPKLHPHEPTWPVRLFSISFNRGTENSLLLNHDFLVLFVCLRGSLRRIMLSTGPSNLWKPSLPRVATLTAVVLRTVAARGLSSRSASSPK